MFLIQTKANNVNDLDTVYTVDTGFYKSVQWLKCLSRSPKVNGNAV